MMRQLSQGQFLALVKTVQTTIKIQQELSGSPLLKDREETGTEVNLVKPTVATLMKSKIVMLALLPTTKQQNRL